MPVINPMKMLYKRLSTVGFTRPYVKNTALPSWWDDEIALNPMGYAQGLMLLSRHLGLDLRSLQEDSAVLRLREFGVCKYKKRADVAEDDLALARVIATRSAQIAAAAVSTPFASMPNSAAELRQQIIDAGSPWVGLSELLAYCWSIGIPVLHLDHFPPHARRPDGFAARVNGRPVIVLCKKAKHSAWLLFILAHELGHIALGHIGDDGTLIDDRMEDEGVRNDDEEKQANSFAVELITGSSETSFTPGGRWMNAQELADYAKQTGRRRKVDPGHIVLNYAHNMGGEFYAVAQAALKIVEPDASAVSIVRTEMAAHLDWSLLPEDSSEFLMRVVRHGSTT